MANDYPDFMSPWHEQMRVDLSDDEPRSSQAELPLIMGDPKSQRELASMRTLVVDAHRTMEDILCDQLLGYIHVQSSEFLKA